MSASDDGFEYLADLSDLPAGALKAVMRADGAEVCLFNHDGAIGAVSNICSHAAFLISDGALRPDGMLECAWHGARFDCRTGDVCRGPATDPLAVFHVRIHANRVLVGPRGQ
ncbi:MAG: Rieske 2Fe-2S domain-containing protein [Gemmatimonadaceae bacterium]